MKTQVQVISLLDDDPSILEVPQPDLSSNFFETIQSREKSPPLSYISQKDPEYKELYKSWKSRRAVRSKYLAYKPKFLALCPTCSQVYTPQQLKRHSKIHKRSEGCYSHLKVGGQYRCLACKETHEVYRSYLALKDHFQVHSAEQLLSSGYTSLVANMLNQQPEPVSLQEIEEVQNLVYEAESLQKEESNIHSARQQINQSCQKLNEVQSQQNKASKPKTQTQVQSKTQFKKLDIRSLPFTISLEIGNILAQAQNLNLIRAQENQISSKRSHVKVHKLKSLEHNFDKVHGLHQHFKFVLMLQSQNAKLQDNLRGLYVDSSQLVFGSRYYDSTLKEILQKKASNKTLQIILGEFINAVQELHLNGVAHRYLKPENVKVNFKGQVSVFITNFKYSTMKNQVCSDEILPMIPYLYTCNRAQVLKGNQQQDVFSVLVIISEAIVGPEFLQEMANHSCINDCLKHLIKTKKFNSAQRWLLKHVSTDLTNIPSLKDIQVKLVHIFCS